MSETNSAERARLWLEETLAELNQLRNAGTTRTPAFKAWRQHTLTVIQRIWPEEPKRPERFRRIPFTPTKPSADRAVVREHYEKGCGEAASLLRSYLADVRRGGLASELPQPEAPAPEISVEDLAVPEPEAPLSIVPERRELPPPMPGLDRDIAPRPEPRSSASMPRLPKRSPALPPRAARPPAREVPPEREDERPTFESEPTVERDAAPWSEVPTSEAPRMPPPPPRRGVGGTDDLRKAAEAAFRSLRDAATNRRATDPGSGPAAPPRRSRAVIPEPEPLAPPRLESGSEDPSSRDPLDGPEFTIEEAPPREERPRAVREPASPPEARSTGGRTPPRVPPSRRPVSLVPRAAVPPAPKADAEDSPEEVTRTTEEFLSASPIFARGDRTEEERAPSRPQVTVAAARDLAILARDRELEAMGVAASDRTLVRQVLLEVTRAIEANDVSWELMRHAIHAVTEYPVLARRALPMLIPFIRAAA